MSAVVSAQSLQVLSAEGAALSPEVSFDLLEGEVLFLRGENGTGKSSILKSLLGLHKHYKGLVTLRTPREKIQYLPQLGSLNFHLPLTLADVLDSANPDQTLLAGIDLHKKWNTASGGERQRVLLASLLAKHPRLLVLDEPFNHVDRPSAQLLEKALHDFLNAHPQSALILVSHRALLDEMKTVRFLEIQ